jgi:DNA-binding MarR family transcriptional regulator
MKNLPFDGSYWINLEIALRNLDRLYTASLKGLKVDIIGAYILRALYQQDGQRPGELANAVGRAPTSFTAQLDSLQRKGLIVRRPNPKDRRSMYIYLTENGRTLEKRIMQAFCEAEEKIKGQLSPEQLTGFYGFLLAFQNTSSSPQKQETQVVQNKTTTSDTTKTLPATSSTTSKRHYPQMIIMGL